MKIRQFKIEEIIDGAYYPGVFIIKLRKKLHEGIQYEDFDTEDWQTFVHEYIHFLQDISTSHGYIYYFHKSEILNLAFYYISNCGDDIIELPLRVEETGVKNVSEKQMLLDFYEGDYYYLRFHHINKVEWEYDEITTEMVFFESNLDARIHAVNIYYDDKDNPYQFGSMCVLESMAYLIERYQYNAKERVNEFPYNACETVCQQICPDLLKRPQRVVMITEMSLMHDDCGAYFWGMVNLCAKKNLMDLNDKNFRDFVLSNIDTSNDLFEKSYKKAVGGIDRMFPQGFPYSMPTNIQLKAFLECGYNYRKGNKLFISDMFDSSDSTEYIKQMIYMFDVPMIIDGKNEYYGKPGTQNMPVADAVLDILTENCKEGCAMQVLCRASGIDTYDRERCTNEPWIQCEYDVMCPVALYFKGYGIDVKQYKRRDSLHRV